MAFKQQCDFSFESKMVSKKDDLLIFYAKLQEYRIWLNLVTRDHAQAIFMYNFHFPSLYVKNSSSHLLYIANNIEKLFLKDEVIN